MDIAVEAGLPAAQFEAADTLNRIGIEPKHASEMFKKAAENGYGKSYLRYGTELYNSGNHKEALKWLSKASEYEAGTANNDGKPYIGGATDNYIQSVELLAKLYLNGNGIERDKGKAAELIDELIKQVNGKINMRKMQIAPNAEWRPNDFNSRDEQIQYYNNQLNSHMSKSAELVNLKRMMMEWR
jgi:TPR repeat protein